jgi:hypothetical protein
VGAGFGVQAGVSDAEALDGAAGDEVLGDDFIGVFGFDAAVPDGIGVDDDGGPVLALVKAARLVDADAASEAGFASELRKAGVEGALAVGSAGGTGRVSGADVMTYEDVAFEKGHGIRIAEKVQGARERGNEGTWGQGNKGTRERGLARLRCASPHPGPRTPTSPLSNL